MEKKLMIALILTLSVLSLLLLTEHVTSINREKYEPDSLPTQPKADKPAQPVKEITLKRQLGKFVSAKKHYQNGRI